MTRLIVKVKTTAPRPQENDDTNTVVLMVGSTPQGDKGLKGDTGEKGTQGEKGLMGDKGEPFVYTDFTPPQLAALKGEKGADGSAIWGNITGDIAAQTDLSDMYFKVADFYDWAINVNSEFTKARLEGDFYDITTTEAANTHIDADGKMKRSTATTPVFGTAATKDIGVETGNVMEVGAFGLGSYATQVVTATTMTDHIAKFSDKTEFIYSITPSATGEKSFDDYSMGFATNRGGDTVVFGLGLDGKKSGYIAKTSNGNVVNVTFWTDNNTPTSNLPVASIQAGVGAPKIAYKNITGTFPSSTTAVGYPHGLDYTKILSVQISVINAPVSILYFGSGLSPDSGFSYIAKAETISITPVAGNAATAMYGKPLRILITYEV